MIEGYRLLSLFKGSVERAFADGTGGTPIDFSLEGPEDDDGEPDVLKEYKRVSFSLSGVNGSISAGITMFPNETQIAISLPVSEVVEVAYTGVWGEDDSTIDPGDLVWASDDGTDGGVWDATWASGAGDVPETITTGIKEEAIGMSCAVNIEGATSGPLTVGGYTLDWNRLPERRYT